MAKNGKPAELRSAGFANVDAESASELARKIAEFKVAVAGAEEWELRQLGRTKFLEDRSQEIDNRALAVALFGAEQCAGCRFWKPEGSHVGECRLSGPKLNRDFPRAKSNSWCGRHRLAPGVS